MTNCAGTSNRGSKKSWTSYWIDWNKMQLAINKLNSIFGLADAFNKEDYEVKLASLQEKWNSLCPEFFGWFKKKPSDFFVEGVIQSARECSDVCGLY